MEQTQKSWSQMEVPSFILKAYSEAVNGKCDEIIENVGVISKDHIKDIYFMREFLLHGMGDIYSRAVASRYMRFESPAELSLSSSPSSNEPQTKVFYIIPILCFILSLLYIGFSAFYLYTFGMNPDNFRLTLIWFFAVLCALLEDALVVMPLYVYIVWIAIPSLVRTELHQLKTSISLKFGFLLKRTSGTMKSCSINSIVQSFHPICRAAASFPKLPVSRFLVVKIGQ